MTPNSWAGPEPSFPVLILFALVEKNPFLPSYVSSMSTPTLPSASTPHSPNIPAYALNPFSEQLYIYYLVVIKNLIVLYFGGAIIAL